MNRPLRPDTASFDSAQVKRAPTARNLPFINKQNAARDAVTRRDVLGRGHSIVQNGLMSESKEVGLEPRPQRMAAHFWGPACFQRLQIHFDFSMNISQPLVSECCHSVESIQEASAALRRMRRLR